jgi:hypothetical protein
MVMVDNPAQGFQDPNSTAGDLNAQAFLINQLIGKMATITLVKVKAVHPPVGLAGIGTVDIQPLVNQIDGGGNNPTAHGVIYGAPYFRLQGGLNAVVIDPVEGDIGLAAFASRDISKVVATKKAANPGSFRRYDWADALYIGGYLNAIPTQYIIFKPSGAGIEVISPTEITLTAPVVTVNASTSMTINSPTITDNGNVTTEGYVTATGDITAGEGTGDSVTLQGHTHSDVTSGTSDTGAPNAGT